MNKSKALISPVYDRFNFSLTWQPLTQAVTPLTLSSFQCSSCHPLIQISFFPLFPVMLTLSSNSSFQWRGRSRLQGGGPISPPEEDSSRLRWSVSLIYRLQLFIFLLLWCSHHKPCAIVNRVDLDSLAAVHYLIHSLSSLRMMLALPTLHQL